LYMYCMVQHSYNRYWHLQVS